MVKTPFSRDEDTVNLLPELPDFSDLSSQLKFSPKTGRIWLDEQRMMLLHGGSLGALRNELIETLGVDMARALLTRMGYTSGAFDAELAAKIRPIKDFFDVFAVGPQLHSLEGVASVEPVRLEADVAKGAYYGEFIWHDSIEDEIHINKYGLGADPVCWMQIGYACGYTSVFMGRPIFYREVECRATGHSACRIIGKPQEEWGSEIEEELAYLPPQSFTQATGKAQTPIKKPAPVPTDFTSTDTPPHTPARIRTDMVGASTAFNIACHMLDKVSLTDATVLFQGESGVGKEMFARTLHQIGKRADNPFIAVNCAALPENLVEAELFGV
tara:strand:+ start:548 stop:1531 length:984 start_codon:yes stop_codon:yes gene_type:complete